MAIWLIKLVNKIKFVIIRVHQFRDQTKQKQLSIKLGNNRPNAIAWKDETPEQTKKVIILGDTIVKSITGYDFSHSLENCKVHMNSFPGAMLKCMQDYVRPPLRENPHHLIIHVGTNDISTKKTGANSRINCRISAISKTQLLWCDVIRHNSQRR